MAGGGVGEGCIRVGRVFDAGGIVVTCKVDTREAAGEGHRVEGGEERGDEGIESADTGGCGRVVVRLWS